MTAGEGDLEIGQPRVRQAEVGLHLVEGQADRLDHREAEDEGEQQERGRDEEQALALSPEEPSEDGARRRGSLARRGPPRRRAHHQRAGIPVADIYFADRTPRISLAAFFMAASGSVRPSSVLASASSSRVLALGQPAKTG
jgi:hypothetical protein